MRRRRLVCLSTLAVCLLFSFAAQAGVFYVDASRPDDRGDGTSWVTAKKTITAAVNLIVAPGNTIYIAEGFYGGTTSRFLLNDVKFSNLSVIGIAAGTDTRLYPNGTESSRDSVLVSDSGYHLIEIAAYAVNNVTFQNITLQPSAFNAYCATQVTASLSNLSFINTRFLISKNNTAVYAINVIGNVSNFLFSRCLFLRDGTRGDGLCQIHTSGSSSGSFSFCEIDSLSDYSDFGVFNQTSGAIYINNSILTGGKYALITTGAGTMYVRNSILCGAITKPDEYPVADGPTVHYEHCALLPSPLYNSFTPWRTVSPAASDGGGNLFAIGGNNNSSPVLSPGIKTFNRTGYAMLRVDDWGAWTTNYVQSLESLASKYGVKFTWAAQGYAFDQGYLSQQAILDIAAMKKRGLVSVEPHGYTHNPMANITDGMVLFTAAKDSTAISIDRASDIITLGPDSLTPFRNISLYGISQWLKNHGATTNLVDFNISRMLGESLADGAGIGSLNFTALVDPTGNSGYLNTEINYSYNLFNSIFGSPPKTLIVPYNSTNPTIQALARATGYTSATGITSTVSNSLSNLNVYNVFTLGADQLIGDTIAETIDRTKLLMQTMASSGQAITILAHDDAQASSVDGANGWYAIIQGILQSRANVQVLTTAEFGALVQADPAYDPSTGYIAKTYSQRSGFGIAGDSNLINAGMKAGETGLTGFQKDGSGIERFFAPYDRLNIGVDQSYSDATRLTSDPFTSAVTLAGSTGNTEGTIVNTNGVGGSVWFAWTADSSGLVSLDTNGTSIGTSLAVYVGPTVDQLTMIASNDLSLTFHAETGTTYRIAVDGSDGASGPFRLNWEPSTAPPVGVPALGPAGFGAILFLLLIVVVHSKFVASCAGKTFTVRR